MASVIIGDYEYIYEDSYVGGKNARPKVVDKTKTSYGPIQSSITVAGVIYPVKFLYSCFSGCKSMTESPEIPNGVQSLNECFSQCYSLEEPPTIPNTVTDMSGCFRACRGLKTAPTLPSGLIRLENCFLNCTSLMQAPIIPSGVTHVGSCFSGCQSLRGNIEVYNSPSDRQYIFNSTVDNIFIINRGSGETVWKDIASQYQNVHYEADDNPNPVVSNFTATRVSAVGSTDFAPTGLYAYIQARMMVYDTLIPDGWINEIKGIVLKDNGVVESATWQPSITDYPADEHCWIYLGDTSTHTLSLQISDSVKEGNVEKASKPSIELSKVISKSYALVDYYHDEVTGTEGMSIGKYAEYPDLLDVDMPTHFRQQVLAPDYFMELDTSASSGTDKEIYDALVNLGWDSDCIV